MDANANLEEQLRLANEILDRDEDEPIDAADAERLAELVVALDQWIQRGGFLPKPWKQR